MVGFASCKPADALVFCLFAYLLTHCQRICRKAFHDSRIDVCGRRCTTEQQNVGHVPSADLTGCYRWTLPVGHAR